MRFIFSIILLSVFGTNSWSQAKLKETFESPKTSSISFCTNSLMLDDEGFFFNEEGCEGVSSVSAGMYEYRKDTLLLKYVPLNKMPVIYKKDSSASKDSMITIQFLDRFGHPITEMIRSMPFQLDVVDKTGRSFKRLELDSRASVKINKEKFGYIRFHKLYSFVGGIQRFDLNDQNQTIYLSFPNMFFMFDSRAKETDKPQVKLLTKKDRLLTVGKKELLYSKM